MSLHRKLQGLVCRQLERSMLAGQPQMDAAGRRSSLISAPEAPRGTQPASQPDFSPATPGHGAAHASFQASTSLPVRVLFLRQSASARPISARLALSDGFAVRLPGGDQAGWDDRPHTSMPGAQSLGCLMYTIACAGRHVAQCTWR